MRKIEAQIYRDGTSQGDRRQRALDPDYVAVDERTVVDWIESTKSLAEHLTYFNERGLAHGNWSGFFAGDAQKLANLLESLEEPEAMPSSASFAIAESVPPHLALYLTFLKLLRYPQQQFKDLTKRHLDFYYRQVLQLKEKAAQPDRTHVVFNLAPNRTEYLLTAGTELSAGNDESGELQYVTDADLFVTQTRVASIKTLSVEKAYIDLETIHRQDNRTDRGMENMLRWAVGRPHQGDALSQPTWNTDGEIFTVILELFEQVKNSTADRVQREYQDYILNKLCFATLDEFKFCLDVHVRENSSTLENETEVKSPTEAEWQQVYRLVEKAYRKKTNQDRRDRLKQLHQRSELDPNEAFLKLWRFALGNPSSGDPLPFYSQQAEVNLGELLQKVNSDGSEDAERYLQEELFLSVADFSKIMAVQAKPTAEVQPQEWDEVYRLLERAQTKKRDFTYPPIGRTELNGIHAQAIADAEPNQPLSIKRFHPFVAQANASTNLQSLGIAIASPVLHLQEGTREITVTLACDAETFDRSIFADYEPQKLLDIALSSDKGWLTIKPEQLSLAIGEFFLEPALKSFEAANLSLIYRATSSTFDRSILNPKSPFEPFETQPVVGNSFYFAHPEIVTKPLNSLSLKLEWSGLPEDFATYYAAYQELAPNIDNNSFKTKLELFLNRNWHEVGERSLFATDEMGNLLSAASLDFYKAAFHGIPNYSYTSPLSEPKADDLLEQSRYFRLELIRPGFQHDIYPLVLNQVARATDPIAVYPPYTPKIKSMAIAYQASAEIDLFAEPAKTQTGQIFQLNPFGCVDLRHTVAADLSQPRYYLLPQYEMEGNLYIGLRDMKPAQSLTMLFQMVSGSGDADLLSPNLEWSYLASDRWIPLKISEILADSTNGLLDSGIIHFVIPETATMDNHLLPGGVHWLKASVKENALAIPDGLNIHTQAVTATFRDRDNDPDHLGTPLAADSISSFFERRSDIESVFQPYSSFGGRRQEGDRQFYTRVSERLRHKQRALTRWDYEHLVLEHFPQIYKVKCLTQAEQAHNPSAAQVTLVVIPNLANTKPFLPLEPKAPQHLLREIETYLQARTSPFVKVVVKNPHYEQIKYRIAVRFRSTSDRGYYMQKLNEELVKFLSPWAYEEQSDISFGSSIHSSTVIHFVETRPYIDYVANLKLIEIGLANNTYRVNTSNLAQVKQVDSILTKDTRTWRLNQKPTSDVRGLNLETGGDSKLFIESSTGNLGLGITKPIAKLHLQQSGGQNALRIDDEVSDTTPLIIDADGKVGIGTDSPTTKLEVAGDTKITGNLSVTQTSNLTGGLKIDGDLKSHINADGAIYRKGGQVYLTVDDNFYIRDSGSSNEDDPSIHIDTKTKSFKVQGNTTTGELSVAKTSTLTGKVGIGVSPSTEQLKVQGDTAIAGTLKISKTDSDFADFYFNGSDGNVGIGTDAEDNYKLKVNGNTKKEGKYYVTKALKISQTDSDFADFTFVTSGMGQLQFVGWSSGWNINSKTEGKNLYLNRDSGEKSNTYIGRIGKELVVRGSDGNTAIAGTLSITKALSVTQKSTLTGNVGIGVAPGTEKLKVNGNTAIAGKLDVSGDIYKNGTKTIALVGISQEFNNNESDGAWIKGNSYGTTTSAYVEVFAYSYSQKYKEGMSRIRFYYK